MIIVNSPKDIAPLIGDKKASSMVLVGMMKGMRDYNSLRMLLEYTNLVIKEQADIDNKVVIFYFEWYLSTIIFCNTWRWKTLNVSFSDVSKEILSMPGMEEKIDYLVYCPLTDQIKNDTIECYNKYFELCYNFCCKLKVPYLTPYVLLQLVCVEELNDLDTNIFCGPRQILYDLIADKLLNSRKVYAPTYIWNEYTKPDTFRYDLVSFGSSDMEWVSKLIYNEILTCGKFNSSNISEIKRKFKYIEHFDIVIIDLENIVLLDELSNNCVVVITEQKEFDYIFIKDGLLMERDWKRSLCW